MKYPTAKAISSMKREGMLCLVQKAINREPVPENKPLMVTSVIGFLEESFLVKLFSRPQQAQARRISREPYEKVKHSCPSNDKTMLAAVINTIAVHSFFEIRSLKNKKAKRAVAEISKFSRRAAFAAEV